MINWALKPTTEKPSIYAKQAAKNIDYPRMPSSNFKPDSMLGKYEGFGNQLQAMGRGGIAGGIEGLGDLASGMTSPFSIAATLAGMPWASRLSSGARGVNAGANALSRVAPEVSGIAPSMLPAELASVGSESIYNSARTAPKTIKSAEDAIYDIIMRRQAMKRP